MRSIVAASAWVVGSLSFAHGQGAPTERLYEALRLKGLGSYEEGLAAAKHLASEFPDFDMARRAVVDFYLLLDDVTAARAYFHGQPDSAYARYALARLDVHTGELDGAIDELQTAIALDPSFGEPYGLQHGLVGVYETKRELDAAIDYFDALSSSSPANANAFSGLGWSYARSFRFDQAIEAFNTALELDPDLTYAHHGLVQSYFRTGRYQKSWDSSEDLSEAAELRGDFEALAYARMMKGTVAFFRGDYRTALEHLHASRTLAEEIGDETRIASTVNNTAVVHASAGEHEKALEYFELSLDLARRSGSTQAALNALGNVGTSHKKAGRYDEAVARYREALALARESGFRNQECITLANMAEAFALRGELDEAVRLYTQAMSIAVATENRTVEAFASGALASLNRDRGRYREAVELFERELTIGDQTGEAEAVWEARAGLGSTYAKNGDVDEAIEHYRQAIERYDAVRESLAIESLGSGFLDDKFEPYVAMVQLLASKGALEEAFTYAEKFKAKGFLDILARGQTLFEKHLPETIRFELDAVGALLRDAHAALSRNRSNENGEAGTTVGLEQRITELELRRSSILDRVKEDHAHFFDLATSEPLDAASVQSMLEPGQVLVEYLMGEKRLSVFVVTRDVLQYRELAIPRDTLRQKLGELSPIFEQPSGPRLFNTDLADFSLPPAEALYEMLFEPIEEWITEGAALIIVPDDVLFYLPFEALVIESAGAQHRYDFAAATFVLERHAVSYSPSASLLVHSHDRDRGRGQRPERGVLAFGNPPVAGRPSLPNAEAEVVAIGQVFSGFDNEIRIGEGATEAAFHRHAERYSVLHFATHFTADDLQPLYSRILLANDDALETFEIFDATLNADLAVLSACNTASGRLRKGEGLIGVSRAFRYAGVPSLVLSLWSVDDEATGHIMESFYRQLRSGASKNEALRQAKLEYLNVSSSERKDPFLWAPFVLSGDWTPLLLPAERGSEGRWPDLPVVVVVVAVAVAVGLVLGAGAFIARARRRDMVSPGRKTRSR